MIENNKVCLGSAQGRVLGHRRAWDRANVGAAYPCEAQIVWGLPRDAFALLPYAPSRLLVRSRERGFTMLLTLEPAALVLAAVGPIEGSLTIFLIVFVLTDVLAPIRPCVDSLAVHVILIPVSFVAAPIFPFIRAKAVHSVVFPLAAVLVLVAPLVGSNAIAPTLIVVANVAAAVWPVCLALAVLDIVLPDAFVNGAIRAVEHSVSIALVILKLSLVKVAVGVPECSLTVRLIVYPLTLVLRAILPDLHAEAVADAASSILHLIADHGLDACLCALRDNGRRLEELLVLVNYALRRGGVIFEFGTLDVGRLIHGRSWLHIGRVLHSDGAEGQLAAKLRHRVALLGCRLVIRICYAPNARVALTTRGRAQHFGTLFLNLVNGFDLTTVNGAIRIS